MNTKRGNAAFSLPLKSPLAPAELMVNINQNQDSKQDQDSSSGTCHTSGSSNHNVSKNQHSKESVPRDFLPVARSDSFQNQHINHSNSQICNSCHHHHHYRNPEDHHGHHRHSNSLARVTELLHRTVDNSPFSSRKSSHMALDKFSSDSPMSSTDSLPSMYGSQHSSAQNVSSGHQCHLFNAYSSRNPYQSHNDDRRVSTHSIFSVRPSHRRSVSSASNSNWSIPTHKSPLHNQCSDSHIRARKFNPNHLHSSPNVKESRKVHLEYDPISKKKLLNTYELIKEIGRGEHGKVKLAKDIYTEELVAIKIVDRKSRPKLGLKPGSSEEEKVRREIAIMKKINHPNIVQLKEVLDDADSRKIYLVLEYLELGEIKWQKAPGVPVLNASGAIKAFRDVVSGLEYLHYQGIIHRDIKPANLLLSSDGSVKISDFGVSFASSLKTGEHNDLDLAKTAGTPAFFAPELCSPIENLENVNLRRPKITYKIDIWSLGVTLYCLLFGSMPFWAETEFELFKTICEKQLTFPEVFPSNHDWTEEEIFHCKNLLSKVLHKNPALRITLKEIKSHPFVLKNLSVTQARVFSRPQPFDEKIEVSHDEVQVAVTGIANKIKKGFAKALKLAGFSKPHHHNNSQISQVSYSPSSSESTPDVKSKFGSQKSLSQLDDSNYKKGCDITRSFSSRSNHKRGKTGGEATPTKTTVEGDLLSSESTAFNTLNHIIQDDKRRLSSSQSYPSASDDLNTPTTNFSSVSDGTISNDDSSHRVSLPVNASFASLDSVYLDNYAASYVTYAKNANAERNSCATVTNSYQQHQNQDLKALPEEKEIYTKMTDFSLNKLTTKKLDEAVAPHESNVLFDMVASDSGEDLHEDYEDEFHNGKAGIRNNKSDGLLPTISANNSLTRTPTNKSSTSPNTPDPNKIKSDDMKSFLRPKSKLGFCEHVSEISVPSMLANDLALTMSNPQTYELIEPKKTITPPPTPKQILRPKTSFGARPPLGGPKYSFFGESDEESESDDEEPKPLPSSLINSAYFNGRLKRNEGTDTTVSTTSSTIVNNNNHNMDNSLNLLEKNLIQDVDSYSGDSESDFSDDEDGDKLVLSFGKRGRPRFNSITTLPYNRPSTQPTTVIEQDSYKLKSELQKELEIQQEKDRLKQYQKHRLYPIPQSISEPDSRKQPLSKSFQLIESQIRPEHLQQPHNNQSLQHQPQPQHPPSNQRPSHLTIDPHFNRPPVKKERVASPLGNNAPKTPFSTSNAHLLPHLNAMKQGEFVNHYKRTTPTIPYHVDDDARKGKGRSNSITVGLLANNNEDKH